MKKIMNIIFSTRLTAFLFLFFGFTMGVATFIENDLNTQASKALVYNTWWFETIFIVFIINFIGNIKRYRLLQKSKLSIFLLHIAFIFIIAGAAITRYIGFEAIMPIKEGETTARMFSDKNYVTVEVNNGIKVNSIEREVLFAEENSDTNSFLGLCVNFLKVLSGGNDFTIKSNLEGEPYTISYVDYIPNAKTEFVNDTSAKSYLQVIESSNQQRNDIT